MQANIAAILKEHRSAKQKTCLIKELAMLRAKDVMSKNVISIKKDAPILDAVQLLVENNISGLPVVNDDMSQIGNRSNCA